MDFASQIQALFWEFHLACSRRIEGELRRFTTATEQFIYELLQEGMPDNWRERVTRHLAHWEQVPPGFVAHQALEPWSELPLWIPPDHPFTGMHAIGVEKAYAAGLRCRPFEETVNDTWAWMREFDELPPPTESTNPVGLPPERELAALASWRAYG